MAQRWVIQWIPVEVFLLCIVLGWGWVRGTRVVLAATWPSAAVGTAAVGAAAKGGGLLSPVFTAEVRAWEPEIVAWAEAHALDPNLVATVMQIESCGLASAVSSAGAQGLFQVMPFHFTPGESMQDPGTNAGRGLAYLAQALDAAGGSVEGALAGYNGGHGLVGRDRGEWPAETQRYVYWGAGIYSEASAGQAVSGRLREWLEAGGSGLCGRAAEALGLTR